MRRFAPIMMRRNRRSRWRGLGDHDGRNPQLKIAVKWKVITAMPCTIELLEVDSPVARFYELEPYAALVEAASQIDDTAALVALLLAGDAGLRRGEIIGLRWLDVDFRRKQLIIAQAV
jgi:integrase